jgi:tetratricopeptide (TPR) repeat protein
LHEKQNGPDKAFQAYQEALAAAQSAVSIAGDVPSYHLNLGLAQIKVGGHLLDRNKTRESQAAFTAAEKSLRQAINLNAKKARYWKELFWLYYENWTELKEKQNDIEGAIAACREAIKAIEKAIVLLPQKGTYHDNLFNAHLKIGNYYKDLKEFQKVIDEYEMAEKVLRKAIEQRDDKAEAWEELYFHLHNRRARFLSDQGDHESALKVYQRALIAINNVIDLAPNEAPPYRDRSLTHWRIGRLFQDQNKHQKALVEFSYAANSLRQAIKIDGTRASYWNDLYLFNAEWLAPLQTKLKDQDGALKSYEKALRASEKAASLAPQKAGYHSNNSLAHEKIGIILKDQKKLKDALTTFELSEQSQRKACEIDGKNHLHFNRLFLILYNHIAPLKKQLWDYNGEVTAYKDALKATQKAAQLAPNHAVHYQNQFYAHLKIGELLWDRGKTSDALDAYMKSEKAILKTIGFNENDARYWNNYALLLYDHMGPLCKELDDQKCVSKAYGGALNAVEKTTVLQPENTVYQNNLSLAREAVESLKNNQKK